MNRIERIILSMALLALVAAVALLVSCAPTEVVYVGDTGPTPTSTAGEGPSFFTAAMTDAEVDITVLAKGYFYDGIYRFQDTVGDQAFICWVIDGAGGAAGIDCIGIPVPCVPEEE